jgi:hypothetical protein
MASTTSSKTWRARLLAVLPAALLLLGAAAVQADEAGEGGRVPLPQIEFEGKGDKCVRPTEDMRRNHMKYILHQRVETVHLGVRTKQFSLKNCVDCHANPKTNSVLGKGGFCQSCHQYASVSIDCFSCHSSSPEPGVTPVAGNMHLQDPHAATAFKGKAELSATDKTAMVNALSPQSVRVESNTLAEATQAEVSK